jgi:uncharacterized coiled-coil DUF342 family protein
LTEQPKTNELAMLTQQIASLREQIDKANAETKTPIERRDRLNEKFKKLRQEINELQSTRDNLNAKVKTLKQQRDGARTKIKAYIEEVKAHNQKIAELKEKTPRTSRQELQK